MQLYATLRHFTLLYATLRYFTPLYATLLYLGRPLVGYINKSYGFCILHVVIWCLIFVWNFMKIPWKALKL